MLCNYNYGSSMKFGSSMITPIFKGIDYLEVDCPSYLKMRYISSFELKRQATVKKKQYLIYATNAFKIGHFPNKIVRFTKFSMTQVCKLKNKAIFMFTLITISYVHILHYQAVLVLIVEAVALTTLSCQTVARNSITFIIIHLKYLSLAQIDQSTFGHYNRLTLTLTGNLKYFGHSSRDE